MVPLTVLHSNELVGRDGLHLIHGILALINFVSNKPIRTPRRHSTLTDILVNTQHRQALAPEGPTTETMANT